MFNPDKTSNYKTDKEKALADIRDTYEKMDLDKSYPSLFEQLWYSQLPCFDVFDVTTKANQDHGEDWIKTDLTA